ncbi:MAG: transposase [Proteobacteria bacterium]|nr:transposase [Pseudomonadota bacterium]
MSYEIIGANCIISGLKAKKVINLYKKRMQIEQNFRDDKNERWGFGWRYSKTKNHERYSILLLG